MEKENPPPPRAGGPRTGPPPPGVFHRSTPVPLVASASIVARTSATCSDSSIVRDGASPFQNGIVGDAPCASSTSTRPMPTRRMRHEVLPSSMMSPDKLSTAKSSSTVPIVVPSGSATT